MLRVKFNFESMKTGLLITERFKYFSTPLQGLQKVCVEQRQILITSFCLAVAFLKVHQNYVCTPHHSKIIASAADYKNYNGKALQQEASALK